MKKAVMTDEVRHRCPGRERGSILIFALTVLFFFSGLAVFLKTMLDSQVLVESRDAEYAVEADLLLASGFDAYGMKFTEAFQNTTSSSDATTRTADALNSIGQVTIQNFDSSSQLVKLGVFYTNNKVQAANLEITPDGKGWHIKTNDKLTWYLELADGTKLTRKAPVNFYIHGS